MLYVSIIITNGWSLITYCTVVQNVCFLWTSWGIVLIKNVDLQTSSRCTFHPKLTDNNMVKATKTLQYLRLAFVSASHQSSLCCAHSAEDSLSTSEVLPRGQAEEHHPLQAPGRDHQGSDRGETVSGSVTSLRHYHICMCQKLHDG